MCNVHSSVSSFFIEIFSGLLSIFCFTPRLKWHYFNPFEKHLNAFNRKHATSIIQFWIFLFFRLFVYLVKSFMQTDFIRFRVIHSTLDHLFIFEMEVQFVMTFLFVFYIISSNSKFQLFIKNETKLQHYYMFVRLRFL